MLLNDRAQIRQRVQSILTGMRNLQDGRNISNILEQLLREEVLSQRFGSTDSRGGH